MRRPEVTPICPYCGGRILSETPVYYSHGELIHLECYVRSSDYLQAIERFLKQRPGAPICHSCVAGSVGMAFELVRKAVERLRVSAAFRVRSETCALCGALRLTIAAAVPRN
jgi:hypothetical protein